MTGVQYLIIGNGMADTLTNNISNSLMVGFYSDIPTLFVGPSSGPGTTGKIDPARPRKSRTMPMPLSRKAVASAISVVA